MSEYKCKNCKCRNCRELPDPYAIQDEWLEFAPEYSTYVKGSLWFTDGEIVEYWSCHKQEPHNMELSNNNVATHWMMSSKYSKDNPPKPPSIITKDFNNELL